MGHGRRIVLGVVALALAVAAPADARVVRAETVLPVRADVVADHERAVGPADEHGTIQLQLVDDRSYVLGPQRSVGVVLGGERSLGHPVTA